MVNPTITVVMSTRARNYGDEYCPNLLRRAIDSVLGQTFIDFEFIIIDDASTDGTAKILDEYRENDPRVKVVRYPEDCGGVTSKRYNAAIMKGQGDWFALMADDDEWMPNLLQTLYAAAVREIVVPAIVYGQAKIVRTETPNAPVLVMGHPWNGNIMKYNHVPNLSVLVHRNTYALIGGGDENPKMRRYSDWDVWRRVWKAKLPVIFVPAILATVYEGKPDGLRRTIEAVEFDNYQDSERVIPDMSALKR